MALQIHARLHVANAASSAPIRADREQTPGAAVLGDTQPVGGVVRVDDNRGFSCP